MTFALNFGYLFGINSWLVYNNYNYLVPITFSVIVMCFGGLF